MEANSKTILIVEDDAGLRELLSDIVVSCGYQASCVDSAKKTIEWLQVHTPFLMILDYSLPDKNAKELITELNEKVQFLAPFVVSTGQGDEKVAVDMMKLGARDYVVKDNNFIEFIRLVIIRVGKEIENENKIKQTESALIELSQFNNQIVNGVHNGIVVFDKEMRYKTWNPNMEIIYGLSASEVIGKHPLDIFPFLKEYGIIDNIEKALKGEISTTIDYPFHIQSSGKSGWVSDISVPLLNTSGEIIGVISSVHDITKRKQAEESLRASEMLHRSILAASPDIIIVCDMEGQIQKVSDSAFPFYGCEKNEELIDKNIFQFLIPDEVEKAHSSIKHRINSTLKGVVEYRIIRVDGDFVFAEVNTDVIRDANGKPTNMVLVIRDITERKLAEEALKESEQYTNSILSAIPDMIFILDSAGIFRDFKTGNIIDLGFPKEQFIDKDVFQLLPNLVAQLFMHTIEEVLTNQLAKSIEYQMPIRNELNDFECFIVPFGQSRVIAMVRNITNRKEIENSLKSSQEELKNFAAHLQSVREEERVLLAREIHDELGQILVALKIDLGIFKQKVFKHIQENAAQEISHKFEQLFDLVDKTLKTTRKIMTGLRPEVLELVGISEAAKLYTKEFAERYQIDCQFKTQVSDIVVDSQQSIALFRILQEALTNIAKHAKASKVVVNLEVIGDKIVLKISDNGIGIDKNLKVRQDSYGLIGMKERVYLLEGKISISGLPGKGTTVIVEMPYTEKIT